MATTFDLKGSLFTLTVLRLKSADLSLLQTELAAKISEAPNFFTQAPIVIDLQPLAQLNPPIDFQALSHLLRTFALVPVGIRHGSLEHQQAAVLAGFARFPSLSTQDNHEDHITEQPQAGPATVSSKQTTRDTVVTLPPSTVPTRVITQPVRSGKQVYAQGGDLLILSSVSPGAEVLADGNIHVYGPLRGRALAGVRGNTQASIFCRQLEAELISIAGHYKINEEITHNHDEDDQLKHIFLEHEDIKVTVI